MATHETTTAGGPVGGAGPVPLRYALRAPNRDAESADRALATEFLLTNGMGGFAMGSALGVPTRRYHGLLVGATNPPVGRVVALHSMVERLVVRNAAGSSRSAELTSYEFLDDAGRRLLHPGGHRAVTAFEHEDRSDHAAGERSARWRSVVEDPQIGRIEVVRELHLTRNANACTLRYTVSPFDRKNWPGGLSVELRARPMTPLRDFHALRRRHECDRYAAVADARGSVRVEIDGVALVIEAGASGGSFAVDPQWWYGVFYRAEADRGQDCVEDLFSPGEFAWPVSGARSSPSASIEIRAELVSPRVVGTADPDAVGRSSAGAGEDGVSVRRLRAAARDFVVLRTAPVRDRHDRPVRHPSGAGVSVIAGYPWFSDWGRDTFISLPGLMLRAGRFDQAARTLETFAAAERDGLIPNVFSDQTGEPEYNTVDASLWFIHAACEHARLSGGDALLRGEVGRACLSIIDHYRRGDAGGTRHAPVFNICMDPFDKLIMAGTESTQLTWMDARRDGVTFTPRHGKPVEINALWHNALASLSDRLAAIDPTASANLRDLAAAVRESFVKAYWAGDSSEKRRSTPADSQGYLYDCLTPARTDGRSAWSPVAEVRPNQLFAVSLPCSPLSKARQRAVVATVRERLLTPMGVRTLDPADPRYRGRYEGRLFDRDGAYHQGTAWPWLLGVYAMAVLRAGDFDGAARAEAERALAPILAEMDPGTTGRVGCFGQIAEVYDGDEPQRPSGCPAQAWSVAVILEAMSMIRDGRP